ncbi:tetratricopeptide repeat protein [Azonexus sp.]|uniref:tetratricopeptide repeat protein n=1 Tax=Azonexus sp. TaxID=1872668 RepID=UPI0035AD9485
MRLLIALILFTLPFAASPEEMRDLARVAIQAALDQRDGLYNLGVSFYAGRSVKQDYSKAAYLWKKASDKGSLAAKNNLGYLYFEGLGVAPDADAAVKLWREAAEKGHGESQLHLGNAIFHGAGSAKDEALGIAWVMCSIQNAKKNPFEPELGGGPEILALAEQELVSMSSSVAESVLMSAKQITAGLQACAE